MTPRELEAVARGLSALKRTDEKQNAHWKYAVGTVGRQLVFVCPGLDIETFERLCARANWMEPWLIEED